MRQFLLVSLFSILLADVMLGLGLSLAPGLSLKNAMLYLLFTALVLEYLLTNRDALRETWPLHGAWALLIFYAVFTWLAIVLLGFHREYNAFGSFIVLKSQLADLFLFLLVYLYGPRETEHSLNVLSWLVGLLVVVNLITLIDFLNIPDLGIISERHDGRLTGPVQEVNQFGAVLIFLIPVTAGLAMRFSGVRKLFFAFGATLGVILLGLTVSRGSWVGLIVAGTFVLYLVRDHVNKATIIKGAVAVSALVIVSVTIVAMVNPEGFFGKFEFQGADLNRLSSGRIDVWQRLLTKMSYWPASFLTGYGWNAYRALIGIFGDPHNTYLLYWFNLGLIGVGLYLFIAIWTIRYAITSLPHISRNLKPLVIGFTTGFTAVHVAIFFVAIYTPWLYIWALTGTILRVIVDDRRNRSYLVTEEESLEE